MTRFLTLMWTGLLLLGQTQPEGTAAGARVFADSGVLELRLEAPLQRLFDAKAKPDVHVSGTLSYSADSQPIALRDVEISVRGHTSRRDDECTFPKLKLKLPNGRDLAESIFAGLTSIKIGTHCGELPDGRLTARFGRLANEHSPLRESFVYALLRAMDVPASRSRPARITYVDTDAPETSLVRYAVLLEDDDDLRARLGATAEIPVERFTTAHDRFASADVARIALAEAMIGNFDWCLRLTTDDHYRCDATNPLWNLMALERADGRAFPVMADFDLAGMVTGPHPWFGTVFTETFVPSRSRIEVEVMSQVQRTRSLFSREELDAARRSFLDRRAAALDLLRRAPLDAAGRAFATQYLQAFFGSIESDSAFYRRVVTGAGARLFVDADRQMEACRPGDAVPPGTPVNEVKRAGTMVEVQVLDVLWHWAPPVRCPVIRTGTVWIDAGAVGADYPPARR